MNDTTTKPTQSVTKELRYMPAAVILIAYWLLVTVCRQFGGFVAFMSLLLAPIVALIAFFVWWTTLSRATRSEKIVVPLAFVALLVAANLASHKLLMGVPYIIYVLPWVLMEWAIIAYVFRGQMPKRRLAFTVAVLAMFFAVTTVLRFDGMDGGMNPKFGLRWDPTPEEVFVEQIANRQPSKSPQELPTELQVSESDAPWFRGLQRASSYTASDLPTSWESEQPKLLWRKAIGPAWSSFAVVGSLLFTQEQRGDEEVVSCYSTDDGSQVWIYKVDTRFEESVAGAGPRATPTISDGKLFALGANGDLCCLVATTGELLWKHNIREETGNSVPMWGFSASPLVVDGKAIVLSHGMENTNQGAVAYDAATGEVAWKAGAGTHSYTSAEPITLDGTSQVMSLSNYGLQSFRVSDGELLWEHVWSLPTSSRILQPAVIDGDKVLLHSYLDGTRLIQVQKTEEGWTTKTLWESKKIKSYFNDSVIHKGFVYGFDDKIFTCVDLATGVTKWKKGRYGYGQVALLPNIDRLLILGEAGQVVLLVASPDAHQELGEFQALEGKTWNHPVIVEHKLYVRNGQEMACFDLGAISP